MLTLTLTFSSFLFWARRDVGGEGKSCRPPLSISHVLLLFVTTDVFPVSVKGMYPAPHIHEHFTIHKWLRQTAYILTHNLNMLEHIANNGMNTTMHTDANIAQF